jgi:CBS domain-containing protein
MRESGHLVTIVIRRATVKLDDSVGLILKRKGLGVHTIAPDVTVYEALQKMADKEIGALVVLDGTDVVGIFSERDYARKVVLKDRSSREMQVREIMSTPVVTVTPKTTVDECMFCMTSKRLRHLPVVDGETVVGLVSIGDLVNWIISVQEVAINHLEDYITGKYPG